MHKAVIEGRFVCIVGIIGWPFTFFRLCGYIFCPSLPTVTQLVLLTL